jgi:hypothetical protein
MQVILKIKIVFQEEYDEIWMMSKGNKYSKVFMRCMTCEGIEILLEILSYRVIIIVNKLLVSIISSSY